VTKVKAGTFTFFDYPGAVSTVANSVNDSGLILGYEGDLYTIFDKGFLYDPELLGPIQHRSARAQAVPTQPA